MCQRPLSSHCHWIKRHAYAQSMQSHLDLHCDLTVCDVWLLFSRLRMTCMFPNSYISFLQLSLDVCFRGFLVLMLLTVTTLRLIQIRVTKIDDSWNRICHTIRIALQCTMQERCTTWQVVHCKWDSNALGYELILMHRVIILKHSIIELHV